MSQASMERQIQALSALAQPTRIRILTTVGEAGAKGVAAGEIARAIRCPASTLSFHLKELSQAGLLEARPRGRYVIYGLRHEVFADLGRFIAEIGALDPSLAARPRAVPRRREIPRRRASDRVQLSMFGD